MAIKKIAYTENIIPEIIPMEKFAASDDAVARFKKIADQLRQAQKAAGGKQLSPKVDDFLYAHCIMMHAAEASLVDENGEIRKNASGEPVKGGFEPFVDHKGHESLRWVSADGIKPYRNGNGDIFPEAELIKAHKHWIGKPLCRDHVSNTVDGVRGIIIDTYYDPRYKRVHALFALDRKNYADLARKVEAGYATNVSMGTAVGRSICTTCGNVATIEAEYCNHVRIRDCFGEINVDLSPIELSIVVTGADPGAKIKTVLAHLVAYEKQIEDMKSQKTASATSINAVKSGIVELEKEITRAAAKIEPQEFNLVRRILGSNESDSSAYAKAKQKMINILDQDLSLISSNELVDLAEVLYNKKDTDLGTKVSLIVLDRKDTDQGQESVMDASVQPESKDKNLGLVDSGGDSLKSDLDLLDQSQFKGKPGDPMAFSGPSSEAMHNFSHLYVTNSKSGESAQASLHDKIASLKKQLENLENKVVSNKESVMSFADLRKKSNERLAYFQGTEDPKKYPAMGDADKIRDGQDKQMVGDELDTSADNADLKTKEMLQRAELEERMSKRAKILEKIKVGTAKVLKDPQTGKVVATEDEQGKVVKVEQKAADDKAAQEKKAFFQGTEEPKPGSKQYPPMGDADKIRDNEDKHMLQDGNMGGDKGLVPGDEALKKGLQRIAGKKLVAKFTKAASAADSAWSVFAGDEKVLSVSAKTAYGDSLTVKVAGDSTYADFFSSKEYGKRLMKLVRTAGPEGAAMEMGLPAPEAPAAPAVPMEAAPALPKAPAPDMGAAPADEAAPAEDVSKLKEDISKSVDKLEVALEEIKSAVSSDEGLKDVEVEMPEGPAAAPGAAVASPTDRDMLEAYAFLNDSLNELAFISTKLASSATKELVLIGRQAVRDAKLAAHEASMLTQAFVANAEEQDCGDGMMVLDKEELGQVEHEVEEGVEHHEHEMHDEHAAMPAMDAAVEADAKDKMSDKDKEKAKKLEDEIKELQEELDELKGKGEEKEEKKEEADAMDKQARKAWRKGLIAEASGLDPLFESTRKGGGHKLEGLDMKVTEDCDKVETLDEVADAMLDVATKDQNGPRVRQAAQTLDKAIKSGLIQVANLDKLVAVGAVDSEAAAYWKNFYGQADGGKEFAQGLVQDFRKQASADDSEQKIVRYKRAFALGLEAQSKGLVAKSKMELDKYVDSLVNLPDHVFASIKNIVEQHKTVKTASFVPQVGLNDDQATRVEVTSSTPKVEDLARLFLKK
jgi:hypothetical protein